MRNCLKCSDYNEDDKWCGYYSKHVEPSDGCSLADINRSAVEYDECCNNCEYYISGITSSGYCKIHKTDTQYKNGCNRFEIKNSSIDHISIDSSYDKSDASATIMSYIFIIALIYIVIKGIISFITENISIVAPISVILIAILLSIKFFLNAKTENYYKFILPIGIITAFFLYLYLSSTAIAPLL